MATQKASLGLPTPPLFCCAWQNALVKGLNIVEGGQTSTGSVVNWFRQLIKEDGYEELNALAEAVPAGCEGLVALDHFQVPSLSPARQPPAPPYAFPSSMVFHICKHGFSITKRHGLALGAQR